MSPITKKSRKQVGILFVDDTNLWEGLGEDDDRLTVMDKGQRSITSWGNDLLAVIGGKLQLKKILIHGSQDEADQRRRLGVRP